MNNHDRHEPLVWEADLRLFGPEMIKGWSLAMVASWLLMVLILGVVFVAQDEAGSLLYLAALLLAVAAGVWLFGFLVMALLFRGRYRVRYTLSEAGLVMDTLDRVAKRANRVAIVLGALSGKPGLLGAGLINRDRETEALAWDGAFRAVMRPRRHLVVIKGSWRSLMLVQCRPDNFAQVAQRLSEAMVRHGTAQRVPGRSPLPAYLGRTALVVLASLPIFAVHTAYGLDIFLPLLMVCFALATVWLIPLFGWVVLGSLALVAFTVLARLLEPVPAYLHPGQRFTRLAALGGEDGLLLGLAGLGAAWLVGLAWRALTGRTASALVADQTDMGDG